MLSHDLPIDGISSGALSASGAGDRDGLSVEPPGPGSTKSAPPAGAPQLAPRDLRILQLIFEGRSNKAIAAELGFTHGTVRVYVSQILRQLGAASRTGAVFAALARGILKPGGRSESNA